MPVFSGIKWGVVGDSLSINLSATRGNYPFIIADAGTGVTIQNVAIIGKGYYNSIPFYTHADELDEDTDVITIFGSTNDNSFQGSPIGERRYHYAEHQTMSNSKLLTGMTNPENDGLDGSGNYTGEGTLAAYVNRAIYAYHRRCPNAKIVIVPPICSTYFSSRNGTDPGTYNAALTVLKCAEGWISNKNAGSWLSIMNLWVSDFNAFVNDDSVKDTYLQENIGGNMDFRKCSPTLLVGQSWTTEQATAFAIAYNTESEDANKWATRSHVHPTKKYNEIYLAPKFANAICGVLGIDPAGLPESLKLNNVTPVTTYTATFKADGAVVDTVEFEAGASVLPRIPAVPAKTGYTGAWEPYMLADADITINAVYTAVEPEPPSGGVLSVHIRLTRGGTITRYEELPPWVRERLERVPERPEDKEKLWYMKNGKKNEITWG